MNRLPLLLVAAVLVFGGAARLIVSGVSDGWVGVSLGALILGAWLAAELHDRWAGDDHHHRHDDSQ